MTDKVNSIIDNFKLHFDKENFRHLTTNDWKKIFSTEMSETFSTLTYTINPNWLYRARINADKKGNVIDQFKYTSELWAPPKSSVHSQGRCNSKGQSTLYCSTFITTTLFEVRPEAGQDMTIIEYKCLDQFGPLGVIGVNEIMNIHDSYSQIFGDHFKNRTKESVLLDDILSGVFKSTSASIDLPIYNLTNAITQIFLNNQKTAKKLFPNIPVPPPKIGLIYPSVETTKVLGENFVLNTRNIKPFLKPTKAYKYKIIDKHDSHYYIIKLTNETEKIYPNGELKWQTVNNSQDEHITDL
jgi:hypothetical protein